MEAGAPRVCPGTSGQGGRPRLLSAGFQSWNGGQELLRPPSVFLLLLLLPGRQAASARPQSPPAVTQPAGRPPARVSCGPGLGHTLHRRDPTASHRSLGERAALSSLTLRPGHRSEESVGKFPEDTKPRAEAEPGGASSHS